MIRNTIIKPTVHTKRQQIRVNKLPARTTQRQTIVQPTSTRTQTLTKTYQAPADQVHYHTTIAPVLHQHKQDIRVVKGPAQTKQEQTQTNQPIVRNRSRTKVYTAAPNEVHNRTIIKPTVERTDTEVRMVK